MSAAPEPAARPDPSDRPDRPERPDPRLGVVHSAWINAWSLRRGCRALGLDLRLAPGTPALLPLPALPAGARPGWAFFTEEASLRAALAAQAADPAGPGPRFWPQQVDLALLDDKQAFADWLAGDPPGPQGLPQWPLAAAQDARYPLLLKARHSWIGGTKLPRGWVCRDAAELARRRAALAAQDLPESAFFLQAWWGDAPLRVLSVGGFHDAAEPRRHLAVVTERVADYRPPPAAPGLAADEGPSSSAMLVTVPDRHGLVAQAARVLRRLGHTGPYELEFLLGPDGQPRVLELNPRFWMQHGLFVAAGNGLLRRYLGQDRAADWDAPAPDRLLWVDGVWLLRRLAAVDLRALATLLRWWLLRRHRLVLCPTLPALLGAAWARGRARRGAAAGRVAAGEGGR